MKKLIKTLWYELVIEPIQGAYNIIQILRGKQEPPEWITTEWNIKEIFRKHWILFFMYILGIVIGWLITAKYYQAEALKLGIETACHIVNEGQTFYCNQGINSLMNITNITIPPWA